MKSLSISTATFAVAISLATSAHANETAPVVLPDTDEDVQTIEFEGVAELPVVEIELHASSPDALALPESLTIEAFDNLPGEGLLTLPAPTASDINLADSARVVTTRNLDMRYGDIDAFYGDIVAFYGDIDAFWGDINPFYGDINAFWGDISPFYGDISAFWGDIGAFWGDIVAFDAAYLASIGTFWKTNSSLISSLDSTWATSTNYTLVASGLQTLTNNAIVQFGSKGFSQSIANQVMARHGIQLSDPTTLQNLTQAQRAAFFIDWHDTVNSFSGIDHVDHWMGTVNWTPAVTQIQNERMTTVVGIIDSNFESGNVVWNAGSEYGLNGHGAGVASLVIGAHDGQGVMGIAPHALVTAFNPFDSTGTATWNDVGNGILAIKSSSVLDTILGINRRASVINLSLGEAGFVASQGLSDMFQRFDIRLFKDSTTYVIAAGNDGIAQSNNIDWGFTTTGKSVLPGYTFQQALMMGLPVTYVSESDTAAIFVGSVRPDGTISNFSNTPGNACLLDNGVCRPGNRLMDFFIVAPGELLLVNDGAGGVTRRSGTSFAAPLVSGAIALLHDRWPWLGNYPTETADIIFRSAKDLGAPGVDPVYGHGLLDIAASQSPLDFSTLSFTLYERKGRGWKSQSYSASSLLGGGVPSWWDTSDVFFSGFETVGGTHRDFAIPMSAFTYGKRTNVLGNGYQRFQDFVSDRFANWLLSGGKDKDGDGKLGVSQVRSNMAETSGQWTMQVDAIQPRFSDEGTMRPVHNAATLTNPKGNVSFTVGHGQGALALAGGRFGIMSDHDHETGGVNPVLGLASGEMFAAASYKPASATSINVGYSQNREDWKDLEGVSDLDRELQRSLGAREAEALTLGIEQQVTGNLAINAQWTHLREQDALLGVQTGSDALLGKGSRTDAVTVTATMDFGGGLSFDLSATGGATSTAQEQLLATSDRVMSTAGQFSINKRGVMGQRDVLRMSVGQPLSIESGDLELRSDQVVDRLTGERGIATQTIGIETKRRYTGEIVYATPITATSELGIMGRYISAGEDGQEEAFMIGANFGLSF